MTKKFSQHIFRVALGKVTNRSSRKARQNVQGQRGCDQIPFFASEADRPPSHFEVLNQHPEGEECGGQECVVLCAQVWVGRHCFGSSPCWKRMECPLALTSLWGRSLIHHLHSLNLYQSSWVGIDNFRTGPGVWARERTSASRLKLHEHIEWERGREEGIREVGEREPERLTEWLENIL